MNKTSKIACLALGGLMAFGAVGCGGGPGPGIGIGGGASVAVSIDKNKEQIYVSVYNGGYGVEWFEELRNEWNATQTKYEVIPVLEKKDAATVIQELEAPMVKTSPSVYYSVASTYKMQIEKNLLEDISDVYAAKPDGANGMTIQQKIEADPEFSAQWNKVASKFDGTGKYMLPWNEGMVGFVYDHDTYLEKGWLTAAANTEEVKADLAEQGITYEVKNNRLYFKSATGETTYKVDGLILRAGKDGKYGTYDDGQPQTMAEFNNMVANIAATPGCATFVWTTQHETTYMHPITYALMAQYQGTQSVIDYVTKDSHGRQYKLSDGTTSAWSIEDGYKAYQIEGFEKAAEFFADTVWQPDALHPYHSTTNISHTQAQSSWLLGYKGVSSTPETGMIVEGTWWEHEAKAYINANANDGRGWNTRDYRYMLLPDFEGGVGAKGDGTGSAMVVNESSAILVRKGNTPEKLAAIKDFLVFAHSNEQLRKNTVNTGAVRPYAYTLTEEDNAKLTKFQKNVFAIMKDTENISLVREPMYRTDPICFAAVDYKQMPLYQLTDKGQYVAVGSVVGALREKATLEQVLNGSLTHETTTDTWWAKVLGQARENGFYNN